MGGTAARIAPMKRSRLEVYCGACEHMIQVCRSPGC
ncbi:MAG: hypothetical protein JWP77_225 [Polaromonas sp.]|nr:hypothetical protein [Polaromonas sp.]